MAINLNQARQFEFNSIYVIDSLGPEELQTGSELYNDIIRRRLITLDFVTGHYVHVNTRDELFALLAEIKNKVVQGTHFPFLHFEVHGKPEGVVLCSDETVAWNELTGWLRLINIATRNNLFVSLATCHGAYIIGEVLPSEPCPFFACVAPWEKVIAEDVLESFQTFFDFILSVRPPEKINFNDAVNYLNLLNGRAWRYYHYNSELLFEKVFEDYEVALGRGRAHSDRVKELTLQVYNQPLNRRSKNSIKREVEERLLRDRHVQKEKFKRKFLILDL
jgi:hypothetical protein